MSILLRVPLRCVFYREQSQWIAHCLEFDLAGHGTTKEKAHGVLEARDERMTHFQHLSQHERNLIGLLRMKGVSLRTIARRLIGTPLIQAPDFPDDCAILSGFFICRRGPGFPPPQAGDPRSGREPDESLPIHPH